MQMIHRIRFCLGSGGGGGDSVLFAKQTWSDFVLLCKDSVWGDLFGYQFLLVLVIFQNQDFKIFHMHENFIWCKYLCNLGLCTHMHMQINMSRRNRKPTICICKNKDADQLCSNCTTDQCLCFHYSDNTILLLLKFKISNL